MPIERVMRFCLLGISVSLLMVGLVSGTFIRHIIQIAPMLLLAAVIRRNNDYNLAAGLSFLAFWLFIMVSIWLFLFGIARIVTGHYSLAEIILTIIMASFSVFGVVKFFKHRFQKNKFILALIFIVGFFIQYGFLILSYSLPL